MADSDPIAAWSAPEIAPDESSLRCIDVPRLMQRCESLGDGCDLGMVQRAVGIEPFGLFRFAGLKALAVVRLLRTNFQHLGEPDDLWLEEVPPKREFRVKSRQYPSYTSHTRRFGGIDDPEVVRVAELESARFLKAKLLRELAMGGRLFVVRGPADVKHMHKILEELQRRGDHALLWVRVASAKNPAGTVVLRDGLLEGYVSHYGIYDPGRTPRVPIEDWIRVCAEAYRLWRKTDPPSHEVDNLIGAIASPSARVAATPPAALRVLNERSSLGGVAVEHRLGAGDLACVARLVVPVERGGMYTFSAWVRVPNGFRGRRIIPALPHCARNTSWNADTLAVGNWQRIWITAKAAPDASSISCEIQADGEPDDTFHSAAWCLERRDLPSGFGFPL
jgi:hypothetical protein